MFVGRKKELAVLERLYRSGKFEFAVLYGRRRVGKTALLRQFAGGKQAIYFTGVENSERQNLENFGSAVLEYAGLPVPSAFASWQAALEAAFLLGQQTRLVLVMDEYPYAARASESLASVLQMLIDRHRETSRLMLILCGSSLSFMEDRVLAAKAPLYGRQTAQIRLEPFEFADTCRFLRNFSDLDQALLYGIVGGTPQYLLQMDDSLSVEQNVRNTFLNPASPLSEEPENLLKQEVREPALYNAVLTAIAGGASRMSEIATKTGLTGSACAGYLKSLTELGLIRKETPYGEKASRRSVYSIRDNMFRFWYRFIPAGASLISRGADALVWQRIAPQLPAFMGAVFEQICTQYLWQLLLSGDCPAAFQDLGRWWGTDPVTRRQTEIDIMGEQDSRTALFAECKWTNEPVDTGILETLAARSRLFPYQDVHLYLFSKSGFTAGCRERAAAMGNVHLAAYPEMRRVLLPELCAASEET